MLKTVFVKQQIWNATCITIFSDLKSIFEGDAFEGEYAAKNTSNEIEWMNKKNQIWRDETFKQFVRKSKGKITYDAFPHPNLKIIKLTLIRFQVKVVS